MATNEVKPSFEELQNLEVEKPSFEEMMAAEQGGSEPAGLSVFDEPFGFAETTLRTGREIAKGASLGLSEPAFGYASGLAAGIGSGVQKLISEGKLEDADKLIQDAKQAYKQDIERQEAFESEYPILSGAAQLTGGVLPSGAAAKLAGVGLKSVTGAGSLIKQAALTGGAGALAVESANQLTKAPYEELSVPESAKRLGIAGAAGATVGAGVSGVAIGVGKAITSQPAMRMVQFIIGPKVDTQKKYLDRVSEIEALPDENAVADFFGQIKTQLVADVGESQQKLLRAETHLDRLESAIIQKEKTAKQESQGKLRYALSELRAFREDLREQTKQVKANRDEQIRFLEKDLLDPEFAPHVQRVESALDELKIKIFEQSQASRQLLPKEPFFERDLILKAINAERVKLGVGRTGQAVVPEIETAQNLLKGISERIEKLPPRLDGEEIKDILIQLDKQTSQMLPGRYGKLADVPIYQVRKQIDQALKTAVPEYKEFMEKNVAPLASFHDEAVTALKNPTKIETETRRSLRESESGKIFQRLKSETGIDTTSILETLADKQSAKSMKQMLVEALPESQELSRLESLVDLTRAQNFSAAVFKNVKDTEMGMAIIKLRQEIETLKNPEIQRKQIEELLAQDRISIQEAQALIGQLEAKLQRARKFLDPLKADERGGQTLGTLLRQSSGEETRKTSRLIDAISQLPDEQFKELFDLIGIDSSKNFSRFAENLRIRHAMDVPRTQGSRRVQLMNALIGGVADSVGIPTLRGLGSLAGAYADEFGGAAAKTYLKLGLNLQGIPTAKKIEALAPIPFSTRLKNQVAVYVGNMAAEIDPEELMPIASEQHAAVIKDIEESRLTAIEKAKAKTELAKLGGVSGKYLRKALLGDSQKTIMDESFLRKKLMKEVQEEALKEDKPDLLKAFAERRRMSQS